MDSASIVSSSLIPYDQAAAAAHPRDDRSAAALPLLLSPIERLSPDLVINILSFLPNSGASQSAFLSSSRTTRVLGRSALEAESILNVLGSNHVFVNTLLAHSSIAREKDPKIKLIKLGEVLSLLLELTEQLKDVHQPLFSTLSEQSFCGQIIKYTVEYNRPFIPRNRVELVELCNLIHPGVILIYAITREPHLLTFIPMESAGKLINEIAYYYAFKTSHPELLKQFKLEVGCVAIRDLMMDAIEEANAKEIKILFEIASRFELSNLSLNMGKRFVYKHNDIESFKLLVESGYRFNYDQVFRFVCGYLSPIPNILEFLLESQQSSHLDLSFSEHAGLISRNALTENEGGMLQNILIDAVIQNRPYLLHLILNSRIKISSEMISHLLMILERVESVYATGQMNDLEQMPWVDDSEGRHEMRVLILKKLNSLQDPQEATVDGEICNSLNS